MERADLLGGEPSLEKPRHQALVKQANREALERVEEREQREAQRGRVRQRLSARVAAVLE